MYLATLPTACSGARGSDRGVVGKEPAETAVAAVGNRVGCDEDGEEVGCTAAGDVNAVNAVYVACGENHFLERGRDAGCDAGCDAGYGAGTFGDGAADGAVDGNVAADADADVAADDAQVG